MPRLRNNNYVPDTPLPSTVVDDKDIDYNDIRNYKGNINIKRPGDSINWTPALVAEYLRCSRDPIYFCKTYMKIVHVDKGLIPFDLYDYQEEIISTISDNRNTIVCTARQAGKTASFVGFSVWYSLFNQDKSIAILANKASTAREILNRIKIGYQNLPRWLQQGIV